MASDSIHAAMMKGCKPAKMTGDVDHDFAMMVSMHHKSAVDMAQLELEHGRDPKMQEMEGYTFPSMFMEGALPNFFTMNGKAYPATDTIHMKVGQKILLRLVGSHTSFTHPIHTHGGPFKIVATDGNPVPETAQIEKDTVGVAPAERYDVVWTAHEPGKWLLHRHIPHHTTNNNVEEHGGGGMTTVIDVTR